MRTRFSFLLTVAALGCGALLPSAFAQAATAPKAPASIEDATAPPPGATKIAIMNIQQAISETGEGKKLMTAVQARFAPRQATLTSANNEIAALEKKLSDQSNTMSDTAKAQMSQDIQTKQRDFQQQADNFQSDVQNAQADVLTTVGTKMMPVIKKYADDHGFTQVVDVSMRWPQNSVLYFNPGTDITETIVKLYDSAHPVAAATAAGH